MKLALFGHCERLIKKIFWMNVLNWPLKRNCFFYFRKNQGTQTIFTKVKLVSKSNGEILKAELK
jgi:hypothetical protein